MPINAENWAMKVMGHHFLDINEEYCSGDMCNDAFLKIAASCEKHKSCKVPKLERSVLNSAIRRALDANQKRICSSSTNQQRRDHASGCFMETKINDTYSMVEYTGPPLPHDWKNQFDMLWNPNDHEKIVHGSCMKSISM